AYGAKRFIEGEGIPNKKLKSIEKKGNVRMIVPHNFTGDHDVTLYVRVKQPRPKATIRIPEIQKEIQKRGVTPGQMIKISLTKEEISPVENQLTLEII
ncbi:MAG: pyridine nucleotide-disulfide oxidoreductase, partial [Thermoplasmata archaeon]